MNLTCQLSITNAFMTNFVFTNFTWTVPGYAISNYVVAADFSSAVVVTNFPTNNTTAKFYWVNAESNNVVQCSATVHGMRVTGQAVFNVYSPSIIFTDEPPSFVTNCPIGGTLSLSLGDDSGQGNMNFEVDVSSQYSGKTDFTQLIDRSAANGLISDSTGGQFWLDHTRFYLLRSNTDAYGVLTNHVRVLAFQDAPCIALYSSVFTDITSIFDQFEDYVMFRPDNGIADNNIYVPLGKVTWSWSAATTYSGGAWSTPSASITRPSTPNLNFEFPQWPQIYSNH